MQEAWLACGAAEAGEFTETEAGKLGLTEVKATNNHINKSVVGKVPAQLQDVLSILWICAYSFTCLLPCVWQKRHFFKNASRRRRLQLTHILMLHNLPPVKIYVGVMRLTGDSLKPVRGKSLPLDIQPHWSSEQLLAAAVKKHMDFNQDMQDVVHVLLYPDGRQVRNIPGTNDPFTVQKYKEAIGKAYQRITLYICTAEDFETSCYTGQSSSEDDSVVHVNLPSVESELSDTVVWDTPDNVSTPKTDNILQGPSRCQQPESHQDGQQSTPQDQLRSSQNLNTWYSNYTTMYAPIVVDSESETDDHIDYPAEHPQVLNLTAEDIVSDLASKITNTSYSRFNINRANIWDGAIRGFKRPSYDPSHEILVKFTDDEGRAEDAVDTGGPKREFLTLLMDCLRSRRIFDGPDDRKFLTFDCAGKHLIVSDLNYRYIAFLKIHTENSTSGFSSTLGFSEINFGMHFHVNSKMILIVD
ncbi:uncharacterized protein LOC129408230 [Boleophthalmus pectinirostris]|uniref:uncharacterized protein LOC129408230 n=1 Tax=Boleophthalmus pectinirostris TaxID=150288 RepID=UPI00242D8A5F|nr:uncharacterized protein LOC129408230 [Boleophthalmus pectinirostris]